MRGRASGVWAACIAAMALLAAGVSASGQGSDGDAAEAAPTPGGVAIAVETFGVGGVVRPGSWAGIRVALTDEGSAPRSVAVRLRLPDDDGDTLVVERRVTLNPGFPLGAWLYARMPWNVTGQTLLPVTVRELRDAAGDERAAVGRRLGVANVQPGAVAEETSELIGVVGARSLGLEQYELRSRQSGSAGRRLDVAHGAVRVVSGLEPGGMPDAWEGLSAFSTLVWGSGAPSGLGDDLRPAALREWVSRGGHLVVMLPAVGDEWFSEDNPLRGLMPEVRVRRHDGRSLEPYRRWLTTESMSGRRLPSASRVSVFSWPPGGTVSEAACVVSGPDGCVAVRRLVGTGMVTLVGLDLGDPALSRSGVVRADAFWHRLLGKRFDVPGDEVELAGGVAATGGTLRGTLYVDRYVDLEIAKRAVAGVGLLMAIVVFAAYWVVAGPGGFGLLRIKGWQHHAWVGFVAAVACFSAVAWAGAALTKSRLGLDRESGRHVTMLDHVYGQPVQRSRSWVSLFLPEYGEATVRLGESEYDRPWRQALTVWSAPGGGGRSISFPDARSYVVDAREPAVLTVPTRATTKLLRADWLGGPRWSMPRPIGEGWEPAPASGGGLGGKLVHDLPATLENVLVVWVVGQIDADRGAVRGRGAAQGLLLSDALVVRLRSWEAGEELDLSAVFGSGAVETGAEFLDGGTLVPRRGIGVSAFDDGPGVMSAGQAETDAVRAALLSMLRPPEYGLDFQSTRRVRVLTRDTHGYDLGRWWTQPCVLVIGQVRGEAMPAPLLMERGGVFEPVETEGRTVVRWVYPLAAAPVRFPG